MPACNIVRLRWHLAASPVLVFEGNWLKSWDHAYHVMPTTLLFTPLSHIVTVCHTLSQFVTPPLAVRQRHAV